MYQKAEDWLALLESLSVDLPLAVQRRLLGCVEAEQEVEQAASKAHHAWVNLANAAVNALYLRTGFWDLALEGFNYLVRLQRLAQGAASVVATGLGPSIGLASASEVDALAEEVIRLRHELRDFSATLESQTGATGGLRRIK